MTLSPEADEINDEDLEAAVEFYDELMKDPEAFYKGKRCLPITEPLVV
jgi:hypothetical protein